LSSDAAFTRYEIAWPSATPSRTDQIALPSLAAPARVRSTPVATLRWYEPGTDSAASSSAANAVSASVSLLPASFAVAGATAVAARRMPATPSRPPATTPPVRSMTNAIVSG
jgi:hypothetical protein